jgi:hypothetical protein
VEIRGLGAPHLRSRLRIIVRLPANPRSVEHMDPFACSTSADYAVRFNRLAQSNDPLGSPTRANVRNQLHSTCAWQAPRPVLSCPGARCTLAN